MASIRAIHGDITSFGIDAIVAAANATLPRGGGAFPPPCRVGAESALLPGEPHGAPADRFLIAAARAKGLVLAARDKTIIDYGNAGDVLVLEL